MFPPEKEIYARFGKKTFTIMNRYKGLMKVGVGMLAMTMTFSSCMEEGDMSTGKYHSLANNFDFSTVNKVNINIQYQNSGIKFFTYFEVYDQMPVKEVGNIYQKKAGIKALFTGYTDENGHYSGTATIPSYCTKLYVYSPNMFSARLLEGEIENGVLTVSASDQTAAPKSLSYNVKADAARTNDSYMVSGNNSFYTDTRWKTWLGGYDNNGYIDYQYKGTSESLTITEQDLSDMYSSFSNVINSSISCPEAYRSYADMKVTENAEVAVTFLGQNTCWNCSLGYYYYEDGKTPSSLNDAHVIMLFPNTQDGKWEKPWLANNLQQAKGIDRGTTVQLKYYPHIAEGSQEGETTVFPAGYRIGFVLATNAWSYRLNGFTANKKYRASTTRGLSMNNNGVSYGDETRTAKFMSKGHILISFEDHVDDSNFSDVVLALSANPIKAIADVPVVDEETNKTTAEVVGGVYAFEDLWPHAGDYDMNDVVARYEKGYTVAPNNKYYEETATFTLFQNEAAYTNSFAVKIANDNGVRAKVYKKAKGESEFSEYTGFTYKSAGNIYVLTNNVSADQGAQFKLVINYGENGVTKRNALTVEPFIFRPQTNGKLLEVHLPKIAPTGEADMSFFGTADDKSDVSKGIYYVRSGNYPFAFFLAGETESVLNKILDPANEAKKIDSLFPKYLDWAGSNGTSSRDWYK